MYSGVLVAFQYQAGGSKLGFTFRAPGAHSVNLAGDFNGWDIISHPMKRDEQGLWHGEIDVPTPSNSTAIRYGYKFVVNGQDWHADPDHNERSGDDSAWVLAPRRAHRPKFQGRLFTEGTYFSNHLGCHRHYMAYFPQGYTRATHRQFPVLYLLHGYQDRGAREWVVKGNICHILDVLIDLGQIPPMIVIMPEAGNHFYADRKDGRGNHEKALIYDLVQHVDQTFRTKASRRGRAISGVSAGGFGAIKLALQYPHLFCSAHAHMGLFDISPLQFFPDIFGYGEASVGHRQWNNPMDLIQETHRADHLQIGFDCGEYDPLFRENLAFQDRLVALGIPHAFWSLPGYHTWDIVQRMLPLALARHAKAFAGQIPIRGQLRRPI